MNFAIAKDESLLAFTKACDAKSKPDQIPQGGYMTIVEQRRQLPDGQIEFTMRRLGAAD